jgi:hypothetical protein
MCWLFYGKPLGVSYYLFDKGVRGDLPNGHRSFVYTTMHSDGSECEPYLSMLTGVVAPELSL